MPLTTSAYDSPTNYDTLWDVRQPGYALQERDLRADADLRRRRNQAGYENAVYDLGNQVKSTRENTLGGLESRGMLRSGETQVRLAEIASRDAQQRARLAAGLTESQAASDNDLNRGLTGLAVEQEKAIQEAEARKQQAAIEAWVRETLAQQQRATTAPRQAAAPRPTSSAPAAGPSQADILRLYAAQSAASAAARPAQTRTGGAQ